MSEPTRPDGGPRAPAGDGPAGDRPPGERWYRRPPLARDDLPVLAAAASAWLGAWWSRPLAPVLVLAAVGVGVTVRRPWAWCLVIVAVVDLLGVRAHAGLDAVPEGPFDATVTLVTDPELTSDGRLRFEADSPVGHLLVEVRNPTATAVLAPRLAGDRAAVVGTTAPFARPSEWTIARHMVGTLEVASVGAVGDGPPAFQAANGFRRLLDRGARSLSGDDRALLSGLVLGDDRAQPPELTADFRASGLTHLLAVSGQNLAFVMVVCGPLLRRLRLWPRFVVAVTVIAAFALVTRFEPSVVRAAFVAAVALFAHTTGRASGGVRHLAIAVVALLAVDPLLVHALGFRLSVAASAGVLVLAPAVIARLPGPDWFREGLGVTAGAQLAVAPVLVPVLGPMPLAALPANVVAGPLAGFLMVWGLTAGTVAGVVGGPVATLAHLPSAVALWALEAVAAVGASLPLGQIDLRHIVVVAAAVALGVVGRARSGAGIRAAAAMRTAAVVIGVVVLVAPVLTPVPSGSHPAGYDATIWVDGPVAVVDIGPRASPVEVLDALRSRQVVTVGLVVVRSSRQSVFAVVDAIAARFPIGAVVAPHAPPDRPDVVVPSADLRIRVGRLLVIVDRVGPPMRVRIGWRSAGG